MVFNQRWSCPRRYSGTSADIFDCPDWGVLLASGAWGPGVLINSPQCDPAPNVGCCKPELRGLEGPGLARGPGFFPRGAREGLGTERNSHQSDAKPEVTQGQRTSFFLQINDLRSQKTPIESLFIEATEKFRSNLKTMYSVPVRAAPSPGEGPCGDPHGLSQAPPPSVFPPRVTPASLQNGKIHVGYKDLMENYQIVVNNLAAERGEKDTNLVLNLFQSLLDEFTRGHTKNDFEPPKVGGAASGTGAGGGAPGAHTDFASVPPHSRAKPRRRSGSRTAL